MNVNLKKLLNLYPVVLSFHNQKFDEVSDLASMIVKIYNEIDLSSLSFVELEQLIDILEDYYKLIPGLKVAYDQVYFFLKSKLDLARKNKEKEKITSSGWKPKI